MRQPDNQHDQGVEETVQAQNRLQRSLDQPWPTGGFDPIVLSEVGYYLRADTLRAVLDREHPRLADGATIVAAHWRHPVDDYPISGDHANEIIGATTGLHLAGSYRDPDVAIDVFDNRLRHIRGRGRRLASVAGRRPPAERMFVVSRTG